MKYDVNGWKILGRQFESDADIENLLEIYWAENWMRRRLQKENICLIMKK